MIKNIKRLLLLVTFIILFIIYFINSNYIIDSIINYSILFLTKLFPSTFIFYLLSSIIIEYKLLDYCSKYLSLKNPSSYLLILSIITGFPSGAKYTKELLDLNYLKEKEANKGLMYSHFPNPIFVLGSITPLLNNKYLSLKIYLSILISNMIIYFFSKSKSHISKDITTDNKSFSFILKISIEKTFHTLLIIYGTSLFFSLIGSIITYYISLKPINYVIINSIFDLTKGIFSTSIINYTIIRAFIILIILSFGNISIHIQASSFLENSTLMYHSFLKGRIIGTFISLIIFILLLLI